MMTGKNQSSQQMTALGTMLQASTYGLTIPDICGTTLGVLLAIWVANYRQGPSNKKGKASKKGPPGYTENIDFLLGYNPIMGVLQAWVNNGKYPLNFVTQTFNGPGPWTITDAHFYAVIGITTTVNYSESFDDYGGSPQTVSGSFEVPLWNELVMGPDPTGSSAYRNWPYCYRWQPSYGTTIQCDAPGGFPVVTVHYAQLSSATLPDTPISKLRMHFEARLGDGDEFTGDVQGTSTPLSDQQIIYDAYAGCGSASIDLGSAGAIPSITPEVQSKYAIYPSGDCDFVDIIEHVLKSGIMQSAIGGELGYGPIQSGVSLMDYPGAIQLKSESGPSSSVGTIVYDMPVTEGNFLVVIANGSSTITPPPGEYVALTYPPASGSSGGTGNATIAATVPQDVFLQIVGTHPPITIADRGSATATWGPASMPTLPAGATVVSMQVIAAVGSVVAESVTSIFIPGLTIPPNVSGTFYANIPFFPGNANAAAALAAFSALVELDYSLDGAIFADTLSASIAIAVYYTLPGGGTGPPSPPVFPLFATGISDTAGNTWTPVLGSGLGTQVWYATANATGNDTVNITGGSFAAAGVTIMEIAGTDTFDSATVGSAGDVSQVVTGAPGLPGYMLAIPLWDLTPSFPEDPAITNWDNLTPPNYYGNTPAANHLIFERRVSNPGTYSFAVPGNPTAICSLAFKNVQPPTYPKPLLDILDQASADLTRLQCRAGGLWGSLAMTSQQAASEWLKTLVQAANCAPVWSGFKLKLIPMSEVSAVGNGAVYISPTASGPIANLDADNGDFIGDTPITVVRTARTDLDTVVQMQTLNRTSDYQQVVSAVADPASIALYGVRKADPIVNNAIQDVAVAVPLLRIMVRRQNYVELVCIQFRLNARWQLLEPMDLITVTDRRQGIVQMPVRLTSIEEDDQFNLTCEAEPFLYGMSAPQTLSVIGPTPYRPTPEAGAGNVNAPVIFEPVPRLYGAANQAQLWLVVSSSNLLYGGCQVMISTDGGLSYNSAGDPIVGNGITGATVGVWPAAASPDTTNDLAVDLTESLGVLASYQVSDEDNFVYPCYVAGTSTPIPYELMTYAVATMTAANMYTLKATGTGNHLDRGVFGAPTLATGAAHATASRFALLPPDGQGILKLAMDPLWIGVTLYFKFLSFNNFGSGVQALADVSPYAYTPTGGPGAVNPTGAPPQLFLVNGA